MENQGDNGCKFYNMNKSLNSTFKSTTKSKVYI